MTHPLCSFNAGRTRFALVHNNTVRVYDVRTGAIVSKLTTPSIEDVISCLAWGTTKGRKSSSQLNLVAAGCRNGTVLTWTLEANDEVDTLETDGPVLSVRFNKDRLLAATAATLYVKKCGSTDAPSEHQLPRGATAIAVSQSGELLAVSGRKLTVLKLEEGQSKLDKVARYQGHSSMATVVEFMGDAHFATACPTETHVSIWKAEPTPKKNEPISLHLLYSPVAIDTMGDSEILCLTKGSTVHLWSVSAKGASNRTDCDCQVALESTDDCSILAAALVHAPHLEEIVVAKGDTVNPIFERVRVKEGKKWIQRVTLSVSASGASLLPASKKVKKEGHAEAVPMPATSLDTSALDSLRKGSLGYKREELLRRKGKEPRAEERLKMTQSLQQALEREDEAQLNVLLDEGIHRKVVEPTVGDLDRMYAFKLLRECVKRFHTKSTRVETMLVWIKAVLHRHPQHLLTLPDLDRLLTPLQSVVNEHLRICGQLAYLQGRLEMVGSHTKSVRELVSATDKPLRVLSESDVRAAMELAPGGDELQGEEEVEEGEEGEEEEVGAAEEASEEEQDGLLLEGDGAALLADGDVGDDDDDEEMEEAEEEEVEEEGEDDEDDE